MKKFVVCFITGDPSMAIVCLSRMFADRSQKVLMNKKPKNENKSMVHYGVVMPDNYLKEAVKSYDETALGSLTSGVEVYEEGDKLWKNSWSKNLT